MITAAELIARLGGDSKGMCRCLAHEDKSPSLHVSDGGGGKVLVHCHAGCSQERVVDALKARNLWPTASEQSTRNRDKREEKHEQDEAESKSFREAMSILRAATKAKAGKPTAYLEGRKISLVPSCAMILPPKETDRLTGKRYPAMVLPITNEQGELQGAHLTWLSQDATTKLAVSDDRPRRMFGQAKGGVVKLAPLDPNRPAIIGEGVETVLSAMQLTGLPGIAALSSNNLMAITPPNASGYIIAGDHDASGAGQHAAQVLARRLAGHGAKVRLALPSRAGMDWNDLLCSGEEPDQLRKALLQAPWFEPTGRPGAVGMRELKLMKFPPRRALLGRWLTTNSIVIIYGDPGAMKTRLALSGGYAVASAAPGKSLLGWAAEQRARVLYVDGEMPGDTVREWVNELGPDLPDTDFCVLAYSILGAEGVEMPDLATQEGRDYLDEVIEANKSELIIIDSITTMVLSGEENTVEAWRVVQRWALKHRQQGRTILFLHHTNKAGGLRGSGVREVTADTVIRLKLMEQTEEATYSELSYTKGRNIYGRDKATQIVRMSTVEGVVEWTNVGSVPPKEEKPNKSTRVEEMLLQRYETDAIIKETEASKSLISQIRTR